MCAAWLRILLVLTLRLAGSQQCGVPGGLTKIVGGESVGSLEFPWYVALVSSSGSPSSQVSCGGSLISSRHVLSAAHCFPSTSGVRPESMYKAVLGLVNRCTQKNSDEATIASVRIHPDYDLETLVADIAVVTLDRAVSYTPICLPRKNHVPSGSALVIGFGSTLAKSQYPCTLQKAEVNILSKRQCARSGLAQEYSSIRGTICAGVASGGIDSCDGDSGGPLMTIGQGGAYIVQGIVSFGEGCARKNLPGVYTQVSAYRSFIESSLKSTEDLLNGEGDDVSSTLIPLDTKEPFPPILTSSEVFIPSKPPLPATTLSPLDMLLTLLRPWFDADSSSGGGGSSTPSVSGTPGASRPLSPLEYFWLQFFDRSRHRARPSSNVRFSG